MSEQYAGAILDLDGTVYRGEHAVDGAVTGIERLRAAGVDLVFLTNNPIERRSSYRDRLAAIGVDADLESVLTAATISATYLANTHPDEATFVVGETPLVEELETAGVTTTTDPSRAEVVLASMDRTFEYADLEDVLDAFENEPAFYATNPDRTCPVADGEIPDAAAMIGAIEGLTGQELDGVIGKPSATAVTVAAEQLGVDPMQCLVVGDRLETDITMGQRAGMDTALVLSGVTDRNQLDGSTADPSYVLESLGDIEAVLES
ncbi:HAD-IIA family hydrolase [Natrialbaceae archaeon A-CW1-1]